MKPLPSWRIGVAVFVNATISAAYITSVTILLVEQYGLSLSSVAIVAGASAISVSVASTAIGRVTDVRHSWLSAARALALVGASSFAVAAWLEHVNAFVILYLLPIAAAFSLDALLMAVAMVYVPNDALKHRTLYGFGWVVGPSIGALLLSTNDATELFVATLTGYLLVCAVLTGRYRRIDSSDAAESNVDVAWLDSGGRLSVAGCVVALALFHCAHGFLQLSTPLFLVERGLTLQAVGLLLGVAAATELPLIYCLGVVGSRIGVRYVIALIGIGIGVHLIVMATSADFLALSISHVVFGGSVGLLMGTGILLAKLFYGDRVAFAVAVYGVMTRGTFLVASVGLGVLPHVGQAATVYAVLAIGVWSVAAVYLANTRRAGLEA